MGINLSLEVFEKVVYRGRRYHVFKTCKTESDAEKIALEVEAKIKSKRFEPIIQRISIGLHLGRRWRVLVPDGLLMKENIGG